MAEWKNTSPLPHYYKNYFKHLQQLVLLTLQVHTRKNSEAAIKPKIIFIGTHRDCLSADTAEKIIQKKDRLLQDHVRQTFLFRQGSIQFAQAPETLIFTVNNLSNSDNEFQKYVWLCNKLLRGMILQLSVNHHGLY